MTIQEMQLYLIGFIIVIYLYKLIIHIIDSMIFKNKNSHNNRIDDSDLVLILCTMIYTAILILQLIQLAE